MKKTGINCIVWNVKSDNKSKKTAYHTTDSISYILNSEKTVAKTVIDLSPDSQISRECKYIENDVKTFDGAYVGGFNLSSFDVSTAVKEMMDIKEFYGKKEGRALLHLVISLPEEESDIDNSSRLMQLCDSVVKEVFPYNQAIYAIHTNTDNLHAHILVNSVSLYGKKIHQNKTFMRDVMHPCVNKYAAVYGFTQNSEWKKIDKGQYTLPELKCMYRNAIDDAIASSEDFEGFLSALKEKDFNVRVGKYISIGKQGTSKPIRTYQLGSNYTKNAIIERIKTKRDKLKLINPGKYALERSDNVQSIVTFFMPSYKEMTVKQKQYVIHQLRLGLNPWRENKKKNWRLNQIADELNENSRITSYINFYSKDGSIESALEGMIEAKKKAAYDRKLISYARRKYKPILDIYEEMKAIEKKAYLFEYENIKEYRPEYEKYRELTNKLKKSYGKEIFEVAVFLNECNERVLYTKSQIEEISQEYRELKKYALKHKLIEKETPDIVDMIEFFDDKKEERQGVYAADTFYLSSPYSGNIIRIVKSPGIDKYGHVIEEYDIRVIDKSGKVIRKISNVDNDDFVKELNNLQSLYDFRDIKRFNNIKNAREYCKNNGADQQTVLNSNSSNETGVFDKVDNNNDTVKKVSYNRAFLFTQAINHVTDDKPVNIIVNPENDLYKVMVTKEGENIKILVIDENNRVNDSVMIPVVTKKNKDGFLKLSKLADKYGFNDEVMEFKSLDEAKNYYVTKKGKQKTYV